MNIGIIYYGDYPENRGINQLTNLLAGMGHNVEILARKADKAINVENANINHVSTANFTDKLLRVFPFNFIWFYRIYNLVKTNDINCLFIREIPFSLFTIIISKWFDIPCILDMREHLPSMYQEYNKSQWVKKFIRNYTLVKSYEALVITKFSFITTVSDELRQFLLDEYQLDSEKIKVVGNYPTQKNVEIAGNILQNRKVKSEDTIRIVHAGYIDKMRGIQHFLPAFKKMIDRGYKISFDIIGEGNYKEYLIRLVDDLGLKDNVNFLDFFPPDELILNLSEYDVGLCGYEINQLTELTTPGKVFEYMCAGLAVISSPRKPVKRIIEDAECGVVYDDFSVEKITDTFEGLVKNETSLKGFKTNALEAAINKYNYSSNINELKSIL